MTENRNQPDFAAAFERWHRDHERRRARPYGFLAITGMHWLEVAPQRFDDVPGAWSSDADGVHVQLTDGEELTVDDVRVSGTHHFGVVDELGTTAHFGDALVEVCRRDGQFMIRPRHPNHAGRTGYRGTPTYPASLDWVVPGTLIPYHPPRPVTVGATVEGLLHVYESPGEVEFAVQGQVQRLVAFNDDEPGDLFFVFSDLTSGTTTYAACRFLTAKTSDADGHVTLDFNRSTNPPCAYTDFATCPLPPTLNHLAVRVEAGEQLPTSSH